MSEEIQIAAVMVYKQDIVGTYGLVLGEVRGDRRFSIVIGESEAQSIALKLNNKTPPRPLTHDLIHNLLTAFNSHLRKIVICKADNDVYFAELHILSGNKIIVLDARASDAVALAIRSGSPMYIYAEVLNKVGVVVRQKADEDINPETSNVDELGLFSVSDLKKMLQKALNEEKYEFAANLRDALNRKNSG